MKRAAAIGAVLLVATGCDADAVVSILDYLYAVVRALEAITGLTPTHVPPPTALEIYVQDACVLPLLPDAPTWGTLHHYLGIGLDIMIPLRPPDEVREWHFAVVDFGHVAYEYVVLQHQLGPADFDLMLADPGYAEALARVSDAEARLSPDVWQTLDEAGCIEAMR